MFARAKALYEAELAAIAGSGTEKRERVLSTPQAARIAADGQHVLNFCANNYLGLASHPALIAAAKAALDSHGFGLSSVRFICGTQDLHVALERRIAEFFGTESALLFSSCFDANTGLFEVLLGPDDAVISDALNHASIIDGIRLCKAERHRYPNGDMGELERCLEKTRDKRVRLIATDGVFSMDGTLAPLPAICELGRRYQALVMVDDSHATGFIGATGRGTPEHHGVADQVDILSSTLGKALGGASGGFVTGRREIVALLRQRARPYLFSNTLAPAVTGASLTAFELIDRSDELRRRVLANAERFRQGIRSAGFTIKDGFHPIVPILLGDAKLAADFAARMLEHGIYVIAFSYPVVPIGQARIRVQLSSDHDFDQIDRALDAFRRVGVELGVLAG
jgi:glycine C-acetyltransferase